MVLAIDRPQQSRVEAPDDPVLALASFITACEVDRHERGSCPVEASGRKAIVLSDGQDVPLGLVVKRTGLRVLAKTPNESSFDGLTICGHESWQPDDAGLQGPPRVVGPSENVGRAKVPSFVRAFRDELTRVQLSH